MVERRVLGPGDGELYEPPGDLVFRPREEWHTFWNAGDTPARLLEIISPGGLEELFRWMDRQTEEIDPAALDAEGASYGCVTDMAATIALVERHGLAF